MHDTARIEYDVLARIGDAKVNSAMLAQLETKLAAGSTNATAQLLRGNLLRRSGDLAGARKALCGDSEQSPDIAIPPGLITQPDNFVAPLIVIDDLLPEQDMAALHVHACELEPSFRNAKVSSGDHRYDPDKRQTLLTWEFDMQRAYFLEFVASNLERFQDALGLPHFNVERSDIKLTNHLEGGFFNTHRDNHGAGNEAGRALTWLYYFSAMPPRFSGGELFILDTNPAKRQSSDCFLTKVEPRPNRFVAFPSWFYHAVGPTHVPGNRFADGRFAVSGHVHKPADTMEWAW